MKRRARQGPAARKLRRLIERSGQDTKTLARKSRVAYDPLVRWVAGRTRTIDLDVASKVHKTLTGEPLL
jgi:hypothetical protein